QPNSQIPVNSNTDRVYLAGGYAQTPLLVVNASDKTNPVTVTTISNSGGGVTVNKNTNLFYSSNGFGGQVLVYDGTNNSQIGSATIGACPGQFDIDITRNLIYVVRQCGGGNDPLYVIDGTNNAIVANG